MLDVDLDRVVVSAGGRMLRDVSGSFPRGTITALAGKAGSGKTTILDVIAGRIRISSGAVRIGTREVQSLGESKRPLLYVSSNDRVPRFRTVQHVLIAALNRRGLDREDRLAELELLLDKWSLRSEAATRVAALSSGERVRARLAGIEALRPAVLLADRILEGAAAPEGHALADAFYRALRMHGTTVITEPASLEEIAFVDRICVVHDGRVLRTDVPAEVYRNPASRDEALALGEATFVPVTVRDGVVDSPIGSWAAQGSAAKLSGDAVAVVRPSTFQLARQGEDSDLILAVEEASFHGGRWRIRGFITGGIILEAEIPAGAGVHKGRLLPLRFDPLEIALLPEAHEPVIGVPTDVVPSLRDSR